MPAAKLEFQSHTTPGELEVKYHVDGSTITIEASKLKPHKFRAQMRTATHNLDTVIRAQIKDKNLVCTMKPDVEKKRERTYDDAVTAVLTCVSELLDERATKVTALMTARQSRQRAHRGVPAVVARS